MNVTARRDARLEVYSYVYEGKRCLSFHGWTGNSQTLELAAGESGVVNLSNVVDHKTLNGTYRLKVRARGERDYDLVGSLEVEQVGADLLKELPREGRGPQSPGPQTHELLPLLALAPLSVLAAKRLLRGRLGERGPPIAP